MRLSIVGEHVVEAPLCHGVQQGLFLQSQFLFLEGFVMRFYMRVGVAVLVLLLVVTARPLLADIVIPVDDLVSSLVQTSGTPPTNTYSGTGYAGMGSSLGMVFNIGGSFGAQHSESMFGTSFSSTAIQVDISGLTGQGITTAELEYTIGYWSNNTVPMDLKFQSYDSNGVIGWWSQSPTPVLFTVLYECTSHGPQSIDVTDVVRQRLDAGETWLGLYLSWDDDGSSDLHTHASFSTDPEVRLVVVPVPEPSALILLATGALGLLAYGGRRRRR